MQVEFNRLKSGIVEAYTKHGFQNIETPTIERTEVLLAKAGGDTEKQIYKVVKTAETADDADQALRFDHTVPLSRYVVEHSNDLTFPFKVTQVGRNFRGERAQKGRFREFYQCDVDVIGWLKLPISYDAEVIATLSEALKVLPVERFTARISNRKLLNGLLEEFNLQDKSGEVFDIIDHAEKVPESVTIGNLQKLGLTAENVVKITTFSKLAGHRAEVVEQLRALDIQNEKFNEGLMELDTVLSLLENTADNRVDITADMMIVRGLDYYTGTVFEFIAPEHREIGSICGGGRYENLSQNYSDQPMPGVGGSIGLTRLFYILCEKQLVTSSQAKPVDICIVPISENEFPAAFALADQLRARENYKVDINLTDKKFGDKMKYAEKVATSAIILGEDEVKSQKYQIKDFETGVVRELTLNH